MNPWRYLASKPGRLLLLLAILLAGSMLIRYADRQRDNAPARETATGQPTASPPVVTPTTAQQPTSPLTHIDRDLQIEFVTPISGATDVVLDAGIIVHFNRPVVVLDENVDQRQLPQPIELEPAVVGTGQWLDATSFRWQPTLPLAGATTYRVVIAPFVGREQRQLRETYAFTFTTALPSVINVEPNGIFVRPDPIIKIQFDQAMDVQSTRTAFTLQELSTKRLLRGNFAWADNYQTLRFFPAEQLKFDEIYLINLAASAQPASRRGGLRQEYRSQFTTLPLPYVETISPGVAATGVAVETPVTVQFSTFMSATSLLNHWHIEPAITNTQVYSSYAPQERALTLQWMKEPATTYIITLDAAIVDEFGNRLGDTVKSGIAITPTETAKATTFHFTTGDLSPFARLNVDSLTHFSVYTDTYVGLYYRNITESQVTLYQVPLSEFIRSFSNQSVKSWQGYQITDPVEQMVWTQRYPLQPVRNRVHALAIKLVDEQGRRLPPGLYLLEVTDPQANGKAWVLPRLATMLVLSNHNVVVKKATEGQSLAWLTDFRSGQPVRDRPLTFLVNGFFQSTVSTNGAGIALAPLQIDAQANPWPVIAVSGEPGDATFAIGSTDWNDGLTVDRFELPYRRYDEKYTLHFFTDRPIYRPGQRVYWKGMIRRWRNDDYTLPAAGTTLLLQLRNSQGTIVAETRPTLSRFGTVDGFFDLSSEVITGDYFINATFTYGPGYAINGGTSFLVAAYRKPEFDITVQSAQAEVTQGDRIRITTDATYFSGGPVAGATVHWRLVAAPYTFAWQPPRADPVYTFAPFDPQELAADPYAHFTGGLVQEGDGVIDATGRFSFELPADLAASVFSQRWTFDVTVQSNSNQFVSRAVSVLVHRGAYYVGLSPRSYVLQQGKANVIDVTTRASDGTAYPAASLAVTLYEYRWHPVRKRQADGAYLWENNVQRLETLTTTLQTDAVGAGQLPWTPSKGGQYLLTVRSQDAQGNPITSAQTLWVSDEERNTYVAWPQENHDRLALVADKALYQPGETAHILVPSPWRGPVRALVTIERGGILEAKVLDLASNSASIPVPIVAAYVPSVYVSVVLLHAADQTEPVPLLRVGYVQLKVDSRAKALQIAVQSSATKVRPGATVAYTLTLRYADGRVAPNSEVTVALIDKAVLALRPPSDQSLLDIFYYERGLGVTTGATIIINRDRLSQQIGSGQKGGGGGGGGAGLEVRSTFPDLAWWRADAVTDAAGQVRFQVPLPDNLTRWVLVVKAIDQNTHVGETTHEIVATKELQVRPIAPRFLTAGDQATVGAVLVNTTAYPLAPVQVTATLTGATFITGTPAITTTLDANSQRRFTFPIRVTAPFTQVVLTFTAQATSASLPQPLSDGVRVVIPVQQFITPAAVVSAGLVPTTSVQLPIALPQAVGPEAELRVKVEGSLAAGLVDGLTYLEHYPYECNEQTVSRFLPNLFTVRAFRDLGLADAVLERRLNYQLTVGVQRMVSRQNPDGGWGYWPGSASAPFTTAYVVWGLHQARQFGYPISDDVLQRGVAFLSNSYISPASAQPWEVNESAFKHFVLAELGQGDPGGMSVLYDNRDRLGLYGKAYLVMAMTDINTGDAAFVIAIDTLINELMQAAQRQGDQVLWREEQPDYWSMNTDVRTSAVIVAMLLRLWPNNPNLPAAVRGLMAARQNGAWGNTQETAWSIIALTDWLRLTQELAGNYTWQVHLNNTLLGSGVVDDQTRTQSVEVQSHSFVEPADPSARLTISRSNNSGQLYYATTVRYAVDALAVAPVSQGIILERAFVITRTPSTQAQVGDWITMTLWITATEELHHLLLEAPLPAGTEPSDSRLPTPMDAYTNMNMIAISRSWPNANGKQVDYQPLWPSYVDVRDDKIALFATYVPAGHYYVTIPIRATLPGDYRVLPAYAEMMYFPSIMGRSAGTQLHIEEAN